MISFSCLRWILTEREKNLSITNCTRYSISTLESYFLPQVLMIGSWDCDLDHVSSTTPLYRCNVTKNVSWKMEKGRFKWFCLDEAFSEDLETHDWIYGCILNREGDQSITRLGVIDEGLLSSIQYEVRSFHWVSFSADEGELQICSRIASCFLEKSR